MNFQGMELNFISIADINSKAKATIHLSGKLGFNSEASELMKLDEVSWFRIALDGTFENYNHIYLQPVKEGDEHSVKVLKSGSYYSLPLASMFDKLGINYVENKVIFDITLEKYQGESIYKLKRRAKDIVRSSIGSSKEDNEE